jgi:hypothetical protein
LKYGINLACSHEVVGRLLLSGETGTFISIVSIIIGIITHDIVDHSGIVVQLVALATSSLDGRSLLLLVLSVLLLLLSSKLLVEDQLQVVSNLFDLLGVAVVWQVLAKFLEEVLDSIRSRTTVQGLGNVLSIHFILLLRVEFQRWAGNFGFPSSKELICQPSLSLLLKKQALLRGCHTFSVDDFLIYCHWSSSKFGLSLLENLVVIDLVGLLNATIFLSLKLGFPDCLFFISSDLFWVYFILIIELGCGFCFL